MTVCGGYKVSYAFIGCDLKETRLFRSGEFTYSRIWIKSKPLDWKNMSTLSKGWLQTKNVKKNKTRPRKCIDFQQEFPWRVLTLSRFLCRSFKSVYVYLKSWNLEWQQTVCNEASLFKDAGHHFQTIFCVSWHSPYRSIVDILMILATLIMLGWRQGWWTTILMTIIW